MNLVFHASKNLYTVSFLMLRKSHFTYRDFLPLTALVNINFVSGCTAETTKILLVVTPNVEIFCFASNFNSGLLQQLRCWQVSASLRSLTTCAVGRSFRQTSCTGCSDFPLRKGHDEIHEKRINRQRIVLVDSVLSHSIFQFYSF